MRILSFAIIVGTLLTLGIGDSVTGATAGSMLFVDASGNLAEDNANLYYNDTNNQLLLGDGSAANPSVAFKTQSTLGLYKSGASKLGISVAGKNVFEVTDQRTIGKNDTTDSTVKHWRYSSGHYLNAEEPLTGLFMESQSAANYVSVGGGSDQGNCATILGFYVAANTTTVLGTRVMSFDGATKDCLIQEGHVLLTGTDKQFKTNFGTATNPPYAFQSSTSSGMFMPSAAKLGWSCAGVQAAQLDTSWGLKLQNTAADATNKAFRFGSSHYTNAEEPVSAVQVVSTVNTNIVSIGGGSSISNTATQVSLYSASNNTTLSGTERMRVCSAGQINAAKSMSIGKSMGSTPATILELEETNVLSAGVSDGYSSTLTLDPAYSASTPVTVTRHNYIDMQNPDGGANVTITDAAIIRLDAALGTHKATTNLDKTGNTKAGTLKINCNGVIYHLQLYTEN